MDDNSPPNAAHLGLVRRRQVVGALPATLILGSLGSSACAQAAGPAWRSSAFPSFAVAVEHWSRNGGTLVVDRDHVERSPVTMNCLRGMSYRLTTDGPRTISYGGPPFHWFLCIYSEGGNAFTIDGALTIDGRGNCSMPFFARFENAAGTVRRDFSVTGLTARNARMRRGVSPIDGSRTNAYGAAAMMFLGGFDRLTLRGVKAFDVTRDAGAGLSGSQGCIGIGVIARLGSAASARSVVIEDFEISRIDSGDAPGSPARTDMDGISVFQSAERGGSAPLIQRGTIREAAGRAIKVFAAGGGGMTRDISVYRSVQGSAPVSNDIAHQHGDGTIENISLYYSGSANRGVTVPIGMSAGQVRGPGFPFGRGIVRNIRIQDITGQAKRTLVTFFFGLRDAAPRSYLIADIEDSGTAETLFLPGGLGSSQEAVVEIERASVNLTTGLMASEDDARRLRVRASGLVNRSGRNLPRKVFYNGRAAPPGQGGTFTFDQTVRGFTG